MARAPECPNHRWWWFSPGPWMPRLCSIHEPKKKPTAAPGDDARSWRTQRVADHAGERAGRRHGIVQIRERPAALVPGVAAHRPHVLHTAVDEGACRKRLGAGIPVAARRPMNL